MAALPGAVVAIGLPALVLLIVGAVSVIHATSPEPLVVPRVDWLRFGFDDVFTEAPLFLLVALAVGLASPALGVLLVLVFAVGDISAAALQPHELRPAPAAFAGRLVGIWVLWLVVVEVPVLARLLALSSPRLAGNRRAVAALNGLAAGLLTFLWSQAAAVLIRPVFTWTSLPSGVRLEAIQPLQAGGIVLALAAGVVATAVALRRDQTDLLVGAPRSTREPRSNARVAVVIRSGRRIIAAALLTVGLGGLVAGPLDAIVLFVAIAAARPFAQRMAYGTPIELMLRRLTPIPRFALALALVFGIALLTVGSNGLRGVSEFFSVIACVAAGIFVIELVMVPPPREGLPAASMPASVAAGGALGVALLLITLAAPVSAMADNCASFSDCWSTATLAVLAALALPFFIAIALGVPSGSFFRSDPPPPPPPQIGPTKRPWMQGDPWPRGWCRGKHEGGIRPDGTRQPGWPSGKTPGGPDGGSPP